VTAEILQVFPDALGVRLHYLDDGLEVEVELPHPLPSGERAQKQAILIEKLATLGNIRSVQITTRL
jgi:hypothetical protein